MMMDLGRVGSGGGGCGCGLVVVICSVCSDGVGDGGSWWSQGREALVGGGGGRCSAGEG